MNIIIKLSTIYFLCMTTVLNADSLYCSDIYTTITGNKKGESIKADGSQGNGNTKIKIAFGKKHLYLGSGTDKVELIYLGNGPSNIFSFPSVLGGNVYESLNYQNLSPFTPS